MNINILLSANLFGDHCTYSFIFPVLNSINLIKESGNKLNFFYSLKKDIFDCNILIIDSRFCGKLKNKNDFINFLIKNRSKNIKLILVDTADNSGQIKTEFLPHVDRYWKGQVLKRKEEYMSSHYGGRLFTDFYNKKFKVLDRSENYSDPIKNKSVLKKIKVCWNMGLCDHGKFSHIKQKLYSIFKFNFFINNTKSFFLPNKNRKLNISCRIGTKYERETVSFQRIKISKLLEKYITTTKLSRFKYLNELSNSKYSISPFGWGELCPRDFEAFINGVVLIKPDMETIDTWPNWYIPNKTYLSFDWDLKNFITRLEFALGNYKKFKEIAINAQKRYLYYTQGKESQELFAKRFLELVKS